MGNEDGERVVNGTGGVARILQQWKITVNNNSLSVSEPRRGDFVHNQF